MSAPEKIFESGDVSRRLMCGEPCGEDKCKVMDAKSGCLCFMASEEIEDTRLALYEAERAVDSIPALIAQARRDALEEAAQAAHDATTHPSAYACREAIRALIEKEAAP